MPKQQGGDKDAQYRVLGHLARRAKRARDTAQSGQGNRKPDGCRAQQQQAQQRIAGLRRRDQPAQPRQQDERDRNGRRNAR